MHLVTDGRGLPLTVEVTAGQVHESTRLESVVSAVRIGRRKKPKALAGDKGYQCRRILLWLRRRRIRDVIPTKSNQQRVEGFDKKAYKQRHVIECCIGWLKECRRIATRFEKLAVNFLAMLKLAMIRRCLRAGFSDSA